MTPFLVSEFGRLTISNLIKECFGSEFLDVNRKDQVDYIFRYLNDLKAETVLLESEYVDKDYLDDYAKFYVRRFSSRGHKCARLHFFRGKWEHFHIEACLGKGGPDSELQKLQKDYLGFVVIKPLPKTVIGKTCLKLYEGLNSGSKVALKRTYTVNLFGIELSVDSIAFQEQDKVTSACAATSIWSALHALQWRSLREIPSCSEITTNAINFIPGSSNSFPSRELTNKQILRALDVERLRHHSHNLTDTSQDKAKDLIQCYIRSALPLILGVEVYTIEGNGELTKRAGHALTIVGFDFSDSDPSIYVHDDRLGPFARARFVRLNPSEGEVGYKVREPQQWGLVLQKKDDLGRWIKPHELLVPETLFAMTDKKARLSIDLILNTCRLIQRVYRNGINVLAPDNINSPDFALDFDVSLMELTQIKKEVLKVELPDAATMPDSLTDAQHRRVALLTNGFARFQWVARFKHGNKPAFLMLVDATDIPQGHAVSAIYIQDPLAMQAVISAIEESGVGVDALADVERSSFLASFLRRARPSERTLHHHLDESYGEPRAPKRLKAKEVKNDNVVANKHRCAYYEAVDERLDELFPDLVSDLNAFMIWVIDHEGTLIIGQEIDQAGHPTLTDFKPARIGGELRKDASGWMINSKSGRYSGNYQNANVLLDNALKRFKAIFHRSRDELKAKHWSPPSAPPEHSSPLTDKV
ncbi:hypothetical protein ACFONN_10310 [Dyella humi]|uniref:Peptidase C58 YopT-type domain-containing protein n=1 Tax=Dyella humi TaxID=1770547 RepID=A0ABW8IJK5_9GAMM